MFKNRWIWIIVFSIIFTGGVFFEWIEFFTGQYLKIGNYNRPKIGLIWELQHDKRKANNKLNKLATENFLIQNEFISFEQLISIVKSRSNGVTISASKFMHFFKNLPTFISDEMFSPYSILCFFCEQKWNRTHLKKDGNKIKILLLDSKGLVLAETSINYNIVFPGLDTNHMYSKTKFDYEGRLENLVMFKDSIYSASVFFSNLSMFSLEIQKKIIPLPKKLLDFENKLVRVGISNKNEPETIKIGVEIENAGNRRVIFFKCQKKEVNSIRRKIKGPDHSNLLETKFRIIENR